MGCHIITCWHSPEISIKSLIWYAITACMPTSTQDFACTEFLELEKQYANKLPMQIDEATTIVEVSVNCTTRIVKYVKHLSVNANQLASGFAKRKQRQYLNLYCNSQGLATNGWTGTTMKSMNVCCVPKIAVELWFLSVSSRESGSWNPQYQRQKIPPHLNN